MTRLPRCDVWRGVVVVAVVVGDVRQKCMDSLFPVDVHIIFVAVLAVLTRLRQIELFEG